jgi:flagellar biosynthetic protein FliP
MSHAFLNLILAVTPAAEPSLKLDMSGANGQVQMSMPVQIVVLLTLLTFLPAIIMSLSSFTRIIIVFHFLRQALGTQEAPSNQILIGLALFLTFFIMNPTLTTMYSSAYEPWSKGEIDQTQAVDRAVGPLKQFMLKSTREKDLQLFVDMSGVSKPKGDRYGGLVRPAFDGHDAASADDGFAAVQGPVVHHGRRMGTRHFISGKELCLKN